MRAAPTTGLLHWPVEAVLRRLIRRLLILFVHFELFFVRAERRWLEAAHQGRLGLGHGQVHHVLRARCQVVPVIRQVVLRLVHRELGSLGLVMVVLVVLVVLLGHAVAA